MSTAETSPRERSKSRETTPRLTKTESSDGAATGATKGILRVSSLGPRPSSSSSNASKSPRNRRASRASMSTTPRGTEKLTFADQHGSKLDENHFVEHLHYSEASVDMPQMQQRACCVIT